MNRKQRRASAKTAGHNHDGDNLCPGCNAKAVIRHCLDNKVTAADGEPVMYHLGTAREGELPPAIFDFGLLALGLDSSATITVSSYGDEVFRMTPEQVEVDKRGPWVKTLAAIKADLDAKFGRIGTHKEDHAWVKEHKAKSAAAHKKNERIECQGPHWEDDAREHIADRGQFILAVFDEPGETWFSYTIGNREKDLPELLIVYPGAKDNYHTCGSALNRAGEMQRERGRGFEHGELVTLQEGKPSVLMVDATARAKADYTFQVERYYGTDDYQVRQLLYPDKAGRYPGDPLCAEPYASLPVLSPPAN